MFKKALIIFNVFIIFCSQVISQNKDYKIVLLPKEQGVASDLVYKMILDRKGFLWLGTMFGLVKYDGKTYHIYNNDPFDSTSISFDDIVNVFEDKDGYLWVGTWANGINRFDPDTEKFERFVHNPYDSTSLSSNINHYITQDNSGNIWVAGQNRVLNKYSEKTKSFTRITVPHSVFKNPGLTPDVITYIAPEGGNLILCCKGEILKFNTASLKFEQYFNNNKELNGKFVNLLYTDSKKNLWIGTNGGLYKLSPGKEIERLEFLGGKLVPEIYKNHIRELREDKDGNLWIGTPIGLNKLNDDGKTFSFFTNGQNKDGIYIDYDVGNIVADKRGVVWVSSYRRGLYKLFKDKNLFETVLITTEEPQSQNYTIKNIIEDEHGNIIAGSFGRGLIKLNRSKNIFEELPTGEITFSNVNALETEKEKLWIGSNSGLRLFNFSKQIFEKPNLQVEKLNTFDNIPVVSLLLDSGNNLWVGTAGQGLYKIDNNRKKAALINLDTGATETAVYQENLLINISEDRGGNVWIGTLGGLFKYTSSNGSVQHFNSKTGLSNDYVFSFHEDKQGYKWIGTANGLNKFDERKNEIKKYYKNHGLPSTVINGISEDDYGNIWLSTNKGICKLNPANDKIFSFDSKAEITANAIIQNAYFKDRAGRIYFGARGGMVIIDSESATDSVYGARFLLIHFHTATILINQ